ncbi:unnamed protein product [Polarella glacialis]|uniref:Uncharacterized protein n=1 Tax=Polarella glacialis TaxID=89957 RepID=A0A813JW22_POLGL|nr:unnamed protein product [Polarella glacialis]
MDLASLFATWLNYAVIGGACVVKVPQIAIIVKSRSAEGLSEVSAAMDAIAAFLFTYYNVIKRYPFSTWGEVALISIQGSTCEDDGWDWQAGIEFPHSLQSRPQQPFAEYARDSSDGTDCDISPTANRVKQKAWTYRPAVGSHIPPPISR